MFSSKVASLIAIVATVCFIVLAALQVSEMMSYKAEPSVWSTAP
jgi:hypothetical protein